jgi:glycosyltransferase involved in cell wall biosynthesis
MLKYFLPIVQNEYYPYSFRVRAMLPSKQIKDSQITNHIKNCNQNDVVVLGKKHKKEDVLSLVDRKIPFIFDVSDDKWESDGTQWSDTCFHATKITTTCQRLKEKIAEYTNREDAIVIPDPTERPEEDIRFNITEKMKLVYYGSHGNYRQIDFVTILEQLKKVYNNTELKIITNKPDHIPKAQKHPAWFHGISKKRQKELEVQMQSILDQNTVDWSFGTQGSLVRQSNIVILPVNPNDRMTQSKGNNRPVDALRLGRFVITTPGCPSYEVLKDFIYIGDIAEGYKWALENKEEVIEKITAGQKFVRENYCIEVIADKWKKVYEDISRNKL